MMWDALGFSPKSKAWVSLACSAIGMGAQLVIMGVPLNETAKAWLHVVSLFAFAGLNGWTTYKTPNKKVVE